jgi:hypothetical protein
MVLRGVWDIKPIYRLTILCHTAHPPSQHVAARTTTTATTECCVQTAIENGLTKIHGEPYQFKAKTNYEKTMTKTFFICQLSSTKTKSIKKLRREIKN